MSTPSSPDSETNLAKANVWMLRECNLYQEEYQDCRSMQGRFQQYFVHGELSDCTQWKRDYENCIRWSKHGNADAAKEVADSERARMRQRLQAHYRNNVWEKRDSPPEDWNKPLPEWMQKKYESSYLDLKNAELKSGKAGERTLCVIS